MTKAEHIINKLPFGRDIPFDKIASFLDGMRRMTGYHDLNRVAAETKLDKREIESYYHKLKVPNQYLYDYPAVNQDMLDMHNKFNHYKELQSELVKIKRDSPEEKIFLKKNKKELDNRLKGFLTHASDLEKKYYDIKMRPFKKEAALEKIAVSGKLINKALKNRIGLINNLEHSIAVAPPTHYVTAARSAANAIKDRTKNQLHSIIDKVIAERAAKVPTHSNRSLGVNAIKKSLPNPKEEQRFKALRNITRMLFQ